MDRLCGGADDILRNGAGGRCAWDSGPGLAGTAQPSETPPRPCPRPRRVPPGLAPVPGGSGPALPPSPAGPARPCPRPRRVRLRALPPSPAGPARPCPRPRRVRLRAAHFTDDYQLDPLVGGAEMFCGNGAGDADRRYNHPCSARKRSVPPRPMTQDGVGAALPGALPIGWTGRGQARMTPILTTQ
jgi:hypothetical protein